MSKLSHIDEVEQRNQAVAQAQKEAASQAPAPQETTSQSAASQAEQDHPAAAAQPVPAVQHELPAEEDEEFHGIDSTKPMGALHKTLIVVAAVVVVVAILYIVNSWIHFI